MKLKKKIKRNHHTKVVLPHICSGPPARPSILRRYSPTSIQQLALRGIPLQAYGSLLYEVFFYKHTAACSTRYLQPLTAGDLAEQAKRRVGTCQVLLGCAKILPRAASMRWDDDEIVVLQTAMLGNGVPPSAWIATARCMRDLSIPRDIIKYR